MNRTTLDSLSLTILVVIILILLTSCGGIDRNSRIPITKLRYQEYENVDIGLIHEVRRFGMLYKQYCGKEMDKTIDVRLGIIKGYPQAAGVYFRIPDYTIISSKHWAKRTKMGKEELIFHELGHHVLNLGHDWSKDNIKHGCPTSLMYNMGAVNCYYQKANYFINELFTRAGCIKVDKPKREVIE